MVQIFFVRAVVEIIAFKRLPPVKSEQHLSPAKTTFVETRADYKFFVKGHTKNACDCGFGHIRKHVSRQDCWTTDHIISAVNNSATSNTTVHISRGNVFFKSFKPVVTELYKNLTSVQQYQRKPMLDLHNKINPYVPEEFQDVLSMQSQGSCNSKTLKQPNKLVENTELQWLQQRRQTRTGRSG
ncbi:hypothetical protein PPTG_21730 [Phytophthora nicotianae INRA-310]|uniref:Uncharacterized protein n=4 Tax=Phytophthora nicotianae TaxID=4792 RepID=W2QTE5_PHYN3|nr:hypothetical protein PPTG_21730 [Phytophthora nicotianae INRA-310]ETN16452.1 hypothetical protein PPTG_21730 [Phytophthora nicotianae INRA-310]